MILDHLDKQTADGTAQNLEALYQLFPSCFTEMEDVEGKVKRAINWGKLRELLGDNIADGEPEVYDFTWVGKRAAQREAMAPIRKTLRPCPEESVNWDTTQNLYIEGDNLEVLKLLQNSYMGKVKMIYIDPPYNTGNDFVYHDDFHRTQREEDEEAGVFNEEGERMVKNTESNGKFHSDWCSMIYSRLIVARSLLREDGSIFISIDDNEVDNLRKICDEIFGSSNFVNQFVWVNKPEGRQISGAGAAGTHEYILLYAKNQSCLSEFNLSAEWLKSLMPSSYKGYNFDVKRDAKGPYIATHELHNGNSKFNEETRPTLVFDIYYRDSDNDIIIESVSDNHVHPGYSKISPHRNADGIHKYHAYRWSKEKILKEKDDLEFIKNGDTYRILSKRRNFDLTTVRDLITDINTNNGSKDLNDLNIVGFSYPKSVALLSLFINMASSNFTNDDENAKIEEHQIFLDFFSGSATTAHAVMQLNNLDKANRKYIMVQWPEETDENSEAFLSGYKNICEIGKERIRRAGKKIKEESPLTTQDLDIGFRVFKCDESNYKNVAFTPSDYSQESLELFVDNIKEDRSDLDLLFDCMLRWGITLDLPMTSTKVDGCKIHNVNEGALVACFEGRVTEVVIDAICAMEPNKVVFRDSSFEEAAQKMNLFELFKQKLGWEEQEVRNNIRVI